MHQGSSGPLLYACCQVVFRPRSFGHVKLQPRWPGNASAIDFLTALHRIRYKSSLCFIFQINNEHLKSWIQRFARRRINDTLTVRWHRPLNCSLGRTNNPASAPISFHHCHSFITSTDELASVKAPDWLVISGLKHRAGPKWLTIWVHFKKSRSARFSVLTKNDPVGRRPDRIDFTFWLEKLFPTAGCYVNNTKLIFLFLPEPQWISQPFGVGGPRPRCRRYVMVECETPSASPIRPHHEHTMQPTVVFRLLNEWNPSSVRRPLRALTRISNLSAIASIRIDGEKSSWKSRYPFSRTLKRDARSLSTICQPLNSLLSISSARFRLYVWQLAEWVPEEQLALTHVENRSWKSMRPLVATVHRRTLSTPNRSQTVTVLHREIDEEQRRLEPLASRKLQLQWSSHRFWACGESDHLFDCSSHSHTSQRAIFQHCSSRRRC